MKPSEILRKAVELIDERGWTRGQYESPKGRLCSLGAINAAAGQPVNQGMPALTLTHQAMHALSREIPCHLSVYQFNDRARDKRYVTRRMLKAAKKLEEQGR